ncbi:hypothetical protein F2P81_006261 [Scophthalmus maximus]|uniref:Uncharacterized protein n=1 Tax=Scophthalmus maximus TaxID=52904 RepID=A0A6A4T2S5_SCOMX|nr:hypothetical protein F2P81_006261 [Scophthalmus maximus]
MQTDMGDSRVKMVVVGEEKGMNEGFSQVKTVAVGEEKGLNGGHSQATKVALGEEKGLNEGDSQATKVAMVMLTDQTLAQIKVLTSAHFEFPVMRRSHTVQKELAEGPWTRSVDGHPRTGVLVLTDPSEQLHRIGRCIRRCVYSKMTLKPIM